MPPAVPSTRRSACAAAIAFGRESGAFVSSWASMKVSGPENCGGAGSRAKMAVMSAVSVGPSNAGRPSTAEYRVAPSDHMSAAGPTLLPSSCSGDMNCGVPITVPVLVIWLLASATRAMPKSVTTTRSPASSTLSGFRSRWTMPAACAAASASAIFAPMSATRCHGSRPPLAESSAPRDRPWMSLHDDPRGALVLDHVMDGDHAGVVQPGRRPCLPRRPRDQVGPLGVWQAHREQHFLDRDIPVKHLVMPPPHAAHAALPDRLNQPEPPADQGARPTHHVRRIKSPA